MLDQNCIEITELDKHYSGSEIGMIRALTNLNLEIKKGECVGIVGANGAGKSTLLKVLSRITPPTSGEAFIDGKLTSLMEVGTGLHAELTGSDNIMLYGSLLGLSFKEIKALKPEIIEFSGLEKFMDLPVKKYSSGMKLRLAFSVMAHLPADIMAMDEVLAVGDSMFQQKCIQRMLGIKEEGKTLLFVSHDLSAVKTLCERTIVLKDGEKVFDGPTDEAIAFYRSSSSPFELTKDLKTLKPKSAKIWFDQIKFNAESLSSGLSISGSIRFSSMEELVGNSAEIGINIRSMSGQDLYHLSNRFTNQEFFLTSQNAVDFSFDHQLKPGQYNVCLFLKSEDESQWIENEITLE
ncbi:MAG: lipopolysaccharide transport system ATP-binding protein, partial [Granulosicoccus sp.]